MTDITTSEGGFVKGGLRHEFTADLPRAEIVDLGSVYRDDSGQHWKLILQRGEFATKRAWIRVDPMAKATFVQMQTSMAVFFVLAVALLVAAVIAAVFGIHDGVSYPPLFIALVALGFAVFMGWRAVSFERKLLRAFVPA